MMSVRLPNHRCHFEAAVSLAAFGGCVSVPHGVHETRARDRSLPA